jgi:hypothetical protein
MFNSNLQGSEDGTRLIETIFSFFGLAVNGVKIQDDGQSQKRGRILFH